MTTPASESGHLASGLPYNRFGSGANDVVVFAGLGLENAPATGMSASATINPVKMLSDDHRVLIVNRRRGLPRGTTMSQMAEDYAAMIREEFAGPVDIIGMSTGGSIALLFAIEHPELVRRLVVYSAAHRLDDPGKRFQRRLGELARARRWGTFASEGAAVLMLPRSGIKKLVTLPLRGVAWVFGALAFRRIDPSDMVVTIDAEDAFDVRDRLGEIRAPTLVVGGGKDAGYSTAIFRETADGIPGAKLVVDPAGGHVPTSPMISRAIAEFLRPA
jgi:pimeloyl-ACP methyl ester carboxylesterase